jgi:hypothetical protein
MGDPSSWHVESTVKPDNIVGRSPEREPRF